jgi:hypothetical protein
MLKPNGLGAGSRVSTYARNVIKKNLNFSGSNIGNEGNFAQKSVGAAQNNTVCDSTGLEGFYSYVRKFINYNYRMLRRYNLAFIAISFDFLFKIGVCLFQTVSVTVRPLPCYSPLGRISGGGHDNGGLHVSKNARPYRFVPCR